MIQISDFLTSSSDLQIIKKSLIRSFLKLPRLIYLNIPFMALFIPVKGIYSYTFILKHENEFLKIISDANFAVLQFAFLIFLVPFQMHYGSPFKIQEFQKFLKRTVWPVIIESCKAIVCLMGYGILCLALLFLVFVSLNFLIPISIDNPFTSGAHNPQPILFYIILAFLMFLPFWIRSVQYNFIPFVVFFDKEYLETKKGVLKKSILVSRGVALLIIPVMFIILRLINFIKNPISSRISSENIYISGAFFTIDSIIGLISVIYFSALFYKIYSFKSARDS